MRVNVHGQAEGGEERSAGVYAVCRRIEELGCMWGGDRRVS